MRIKSYFAESVPAAVAKARQEMGPDAMLVSSQKSPAEARHLGEYEVVFGLASFGESSQSLKAQAFKYQEGRTFAPEELPLAAPAASIAGELSDLRRQLQGLRQAMLRASSTEPAWPAAVPPSISAFHTELCEADITPDLAKEVLAVAEEQWNEQCEFLGETLAGTLRGAPSDLNASPLHAALSRPNSQSIDAEWLRTAVLQELSRRCLVSPLLIEERDPAFPVALVGPPGAGKTTMLVKLAVKYGVAAGRPVHFLSLDQYRIGAADQLRSYASLLGASFESVPSLHALSQQVSLTPSHALVLIDTPGYGVADLQDAAELARFLGHHPRIDVHLVLPASMKRRDMRRIAEQFAPFHPQNLLFSKLDETDSYGALLSEAITSGRPLSFFSTGQRIPEDIELANVNRLLDSLLVRNEETSAWTSAA